MTLPANPLRTPSQAKVCPDLQSLVARACREKRRGFHPPRFLRPSNTFQRSEDIWSAFGVNGHPPWYGLGGEGRSMNAWNFHNCRRSQSQNCQQSRGLVSGKRHLCDCRHFRNLTLRIRFQACRESQGWAGLGHNPWGCGRFGYLNVSNF